MNNIKVTLLFLFLWLVFIVPAQSQKLDQIIPESGPYAVGYSIQKSNAKRPVPIHIWYPADTNSLPKLSLGKYEAVANPFYKNAFGSLGLEQWSIRLQSDQKKLDRLKTLETLASLNAPKLSKSFPLILYASSFRSRPEENFALFEYLASHGLAIAAVPSLGEDETGIMMTSQGVEIQFSDLSSVLDQVSQDPGFNLENLGAMGFSLGASSMGLCVLKNKGFKCLVSLDGALSYSYPLLGDLLDNQSADLGIPYLEILKRSVPSQPLDTTFYSQQKNANSKLFPNLDHYDFSALTLLLKSIRPDDYRPSSQSIALMGENSSPYEERFATYREICKLLLKYFDRHLPNNP